MKRSEMVEIIHKSLVGNFIPYYNPEFNVHIEELLNDIEEAGMYPPKHKVKTEDLYGGIKEEFVEG